VEDACAFLHGKTEEIMQGLTDAMMNAAEDRRYEEAAVLRDRISLLRDVMHQQAVETTGGDTDADIIAVLIKNGAVCVNLAVVRGGRHLGDHAYFPDFARSLGEDLTESEVFEAFISHHYCNVPVPDAVISQAGDDPQPVSCFRRWPAARSSSCTSRSSRAASGTKWRLPMP
jgi:excinuclease ABC subunit C